METHTATAHGHEHHSTPGFISRYIFPLDHKIIGMQYLFTGMLMGLIGGFFAYAFRMQLAFPGADIPLVGLVTAAKYNALVTNHGSIMIFWVAMPVLVAALGNYLIPLMIGCDDMVFPKLNPNNFREFRKRGQFLSPLEQGDSQTTRGQIQLSSIVRRN